MPGRTKTQTVERKTRRSPQGSVKRHAHAQGNPSAEAAEITALTRESISQLLIGRDIRLPDENDPSRRRVPRWPFPGTVELWVPDPESGEHYALATCLNLSLDGLGMLCDETLPVGMKLALAIHQPEVSLHGRAVVRHTTTTDGGDFVGLQFLFA